MSKVLVTESSLDGIADAIRSKLGVQTTYKPSQMAGAIRTIPSDHGPKSVTANGTYQASQDNLDGYDSVSVNVPNTYAAGDEGKVVSSGALVAQTSQTITRNGTYDTTLIGELIADISGGGGGTVSYRKVDVLDNPGNETKVLTSSPIAIENEEAVTEVIPRSFVFLFADNQTTNITVDGTVYASADIQIASSWNSDNVYAFKGEADYFSVAWNRGDGGNHAGTFLTINDTFDISYMQTLAKSSTASQEIDTALSEAYVLFLFCVYSGGTTASITFMGESKTIDRYTDRYSNSIYVYACKLTDLAAGDTVDVTVNATASRVIGVMGIFGNR